MADLFHQWGSDFQTSPTGDLLVVTGTTMGTQRVLRRLLTNAGDYLWQLAYGAGLPRRVGQVINASAIQAAIRAQLFKDQAVSQTPAPVITVSADASTTVYVNIQYTDANTGDPAVLNFPITQAPVVAPAGG